MQQRKTLKIRSTPLRSSELPLVFLALLPMLVLALGHLLFDLVGASFANHSLQLLAEASDHATPSASIPAGQVWAATSLIYLVVASASIVYVVNFLRKHVRGRALLPLLSMSVFLIVLGIAHLIWVDNSRQPVSIIFYLTYESLQASSMMRTADLMVVNRLLDVVNVMSVVVPCLFCAYMPSVLLTPHKGWTEETLTQRVKEGRQFCLVASAFLVAGVFHMYAWMSWSSALLGEPELSQLTFSVVFYWSFVFSAMIGVIYMSILATLNRRGEWLIEVSDQPSQSRQESLVEFGLAFKGLAQFRQVATIFAPVISALTISGSSPLMDSQLPPM